MSRQTAFKGPLGLFACLLTVCLGAAAQSPEPDEAEPTPTSSTVIPTSYSVYDSRPASVLINSVQLQGHAVATDPETRQWSERITPVAIRYPGIDLASGMFQDIALARKDKFIQWVAEKWMTRNGQCNNIFQRDRRSYPWENPLHTDILQCSTLNRPFKDLTPTCVAPPSATLENAVLRLRWQCTLASDTVALLYEEANPSPTPGVIAPAVNPASKERSRISIENPKTAPVQGVAGPNR